MKILLENWKQFIKEQEVPYEEIQNIIDGNQYLKGKVEANQNTVHDLGDRYLLMAGVAHLKQRHADPCYPGSLFLGSEEDIMDAVRAAAKQIDPEVGKVLAIESGVRGLGKERLNKATPQEIADLEEKEGVKVRKVPAGDDGVVTDRISVIAPRIGEAAGRPVLSLVTAFPGYMGTGKGGEGDIEIKDRADFTKNGYYFLIPEDC